MKRRRASSLKDINNIKKRAKTGKSFEFSEQDDAFMMQLIASQYWSEEDIVEYYYKHPEYGV